MILAYFLFLFILFFPLQVEPKLNFNGFGKSSPNAKPVQFGLREPCPIGTVPIPRVTKEDLIRAKSLPQMPSVTSMEQDFIDPDQHVRSLFLSPLP